MRITAYITQRHDLNRFVKVTLGLDGKYYIDLTMDGAIAEQFVAEIERLNAIAESFKLLHSSGILDPLQILPTERDR